MPGRSKPITVVATHLPELGQRAESTRLEPHHDRLTSTLVPLLRSHGGTWVGPAPKACAVDGAWREALAGYAHRNGFEIQPVTLGSADVVGRGNDFAHSVLWPLFHGMDEHCDFEPDGWKHYLEFNRKFALQAARSHVGAQRVWVHDYQLIHTGSMLRAARPDLRQLGFFLHIPFPQIDTLRRLATASQLVRALLAYDLIGFQTSRDLQNFMRAVEFFSPQIEVTKRGGAAASFGLGHRTLRAAVLPTGVDFEEFSAQAGSRGVVERMRSLQEDVGPYTMLLGVDRLDYTNGLLHRLCAFERALERHPSLREEVVLYQQVVPSREDIEEYSKLKDQVEEAVGRICGRFSTRAWSPVHYRYGQVGSVELSAMYRLAAAALITPLRDGMNLPAKEFVASRTEHSGVLILSEFAGAASQLADGALLVNPYDVDQSAEAIARALDMPSVEKTRRMRAMREATRHSDTNWWTRQFIELLEEDAQGASVLASAERTSLGESLPLG